MFTDGAGRRPIPGVAKSWEISPDGLTWTFHLRPEVWSDGQPVTANDFVFAYRHMLDPKTGSSLRLPALRAEERRGGECARQAPPEALGARALDDETLQLTLEHPASYLPQLLKHQAFFPIPEHAVRRWGDKWATPGRLVGNGAYVLKEWRLGDYVRIEKNPLYRDAASVCFDRVDFYPINDADRRRSGARCAASSTSTPASSRAGCRGCAPTRTGRATCTATPTSPPSYLIFNTPQRRRAARRARPPGHLDGDRPRTSSPTSCCAPARSRRRRSCRPASPATCRRARRARRPYWADWTLARRQAEARRLLARGRLRARPPAEAAAEDLQQRRSACCWCSRCSRT